MKKRAEAKTTAKEAFTKTTTRDDGKFVRTALVLSNTETGSVDVVDAAGNFLARLNLCAIESGGVIVDVIDVDKRYAVKRAMTFAGGERRAMTVPEGGNLVSVDFRTSGDV
jgi:hypothetical protein